MMRSYFAIPLLALGLACVTRPLPAQFNLFTEQGATGSRIGVVLRDIDADRASVLKLGSVTGVEVVLVQNGSPADHAGIKVGDILLSYNNESIVGAQQLGRMVSETPVGRKVKIEYWRDGKVVTVTALTAAFRSPMPLILNPDAPNFPTSSDLFLPGSFPSPIMVWSNPFGIECEALNVHDSQLAEYFGVKRGVLVRSVAKDSPAAKTGLRAGDVVTQIGDRPVGDPKDITYYLRQEQHLAKPLSVEVMREHKPVTLRVNLSQDPQQ
jgi:serine protease Do